MMVKSTKRGYFFAHEQLQKEMIFVKTDTLFDTVERELKKKLVEFIFHYFFVLRTIDRTNTGQIRQHIRIDIDYASQNNNDASAKVKAFGMFHKADISFV